MFAIKDQIVNIIDFAGHIVSITSAQLCCSSKAVINNLEMSNCGYAPVKLDLQEQTVGQISYP